MSTQRVKGRGWEGDSGVCNGRGEGEWGQEEDKAEKWIDYDEEMETSYIRMHIHAMSSSQTFASHDMSHDMSHDTTCVCDM